MKITKNNNNNKFIYDVGAAICLTEESPLFHFVINYGRPRRDGVARGGFFGEQGRLYGGGGWPGGS